MVAHVDDGEGAAAALVGDIGETVRNLDVDRQGSVLLPTLAFWIEAAIVGWSGLETSTTVKRAA